MELKEVVSFYQKNLKWVVVSSFLTALLGASLYFYLPIRYYATGSLFVKRVIYPYSETHFTYEGYYGQQAAVSYSNSVIGLMESIDVQALTLEKLDLPINEGNLRGLVRRLKVKKAGPQIITLTAKSSQRENAEATWQAISDATIETVGNLKSGGDPYINLAKVSETPVVKEGYRNLPIFAVIGLGFGFLLSSFILATANYFTIKKK